MSSADRASMATRRPGSLADVFQADTVIAPLKAKDKEQVIEEMVGILVDSGRITKGKAKTVLAKMLEREEVGTTGIGRGFAVPHIRYDGVDRFLGAFGHAPDGVEFQSLDGNPAVAIFMVVSPTDLKQEHLELMSRLTRLMSNADLMPFLRSCKAPEDYIDLLVRLEPPL